MRSSMHHLGVTILFSMMALMMLATLAGPVSAGTHPGDHMWTTEIRMTDDARHSFFPVVLTDSQEDVHMLWVNASQRDTSLLQATNGIIMYKKMSAQGNVLVEDKVIVNPDYDSYYITRPSAVMGPDDGIHLVWSDSRGNEFKVYYMKLGTNGETVIGETGINGTDACKYPDVAVDRVGRAHIVFSSWAWGPSNPNIFYSVIDGNGDLVVDNFQVTMTILASNHATVGVDDSGDVHVAFVENVNTPFGYSDEIYYSRINKQGTIEISMQRVSISKLQSTMPDMTIGKDGTPLLVWETDEGSDMDIYYARLADPMNIFPEQITHTRADSLQPTVRTDGSGAIFVVWSEKDHLIVDNSAIWMKYLDTPEAEWSNDIRLTTDGLGAFRPSLSLDSHDDPSIVWEDFREIGGVGYWDVYYIRDVTGVNNAPVAYLVAEDMNVTVGQEVFFNANLSYDVNGWDRVVEYNFSFADGTGSGWVDMPNATHAFMRPGEYHVGLRVKDSFGAVSETTHFARVVVHEEGQAVGGGLTDGQVTTAVIVTGVGIGALAAVVAGTEFGKYQFLTLFAVPFYSRIKREKTLDNYIRGQIHGYILAKPGCHYNAIKQTLKLNNGTLAYHLRKLEKEEFIKSARDGMYKRFYPIGMKVEERTIKLSEMQKRILETIDLNPGISQKEIASMVGISAPAVIYHIGILVGAKLIRKRRNGPRVEYKAFHMDEEGVGDEEETPVIESD